MKLFRSARWFLLAVLLSVFSATSYAGVFISVGFAPPVLPVYEQPPCPEPGLMWMPGYWAYGDDGYYWVPGAWVEAPYEGALWTPGYWGWSDGLYVFHDGYWGDHVGYYGGVNYGFGYMGIGFVGGRWHGHDFEYNRAVMRVDERRIHNVYEDRTIVNRYTVVNDRHVAYSGGPGGIRHEARPEERMADRDRHINRTAIQQQHESGARSDRSSYFNSNHGRPQNTAVSRPMGGGDMHTTPGMQQQSRPGYQNEHQQARPGFQNQQQAQPQQQQQRPGYQNEQQQVRPGYQNQTQPQQQQRPGYQNQQQAQPQQQQRPGYQNQQQTQPQQQQRPGYQNQQQAQPQQQQRPGYQNEHQQGRPGYQNQTQPQQQQRPTYQAPPQQQQRPQPQAQPQLQQRPQPQAQPQSRPAPQAQQSHPSAQQHAAHKEEKPKEDKPKER